MTQALFEKNERRSKLLATGAKGGSVYKTQYDQFFSQKVHHSPELRIRFILLRNLIRLELFVIQSKLEQHLIEVAFVINIFEGMEAKSQFIQEGGLVFRQHVLEMQPPECFASLTICTPEGNSGVAMFLIVCDKSWINLCENGGDNARRNSDC